MRSPRGAREHPESPQTRGATRRRDGWVHELHRYALSVLCCVWHGPRHSCLRIPVLISESKSQVSGRLYTMSFDPRDMIPKNSIPGFSLRSRIMGRSVYSASRTDKWQTKKLTDESTFSLFVFLLFLLVFRFRSALVASNHRWIRARPYLADAAYHAVADRAV